MALVSALAHSIPFPQLSIWLLISPCAHTFFWILESLSTRVTRLILNYLNGEAWIFYSVIRFDHHNPID